MLNLLQSVTGKLSLVTSAAGTIHVVVSGADTDNPATPTSNFDLPTTPTIISTATTTDIFATPASGKGRNAKLMIIRNAHATVSNDVTLLVSISAVSYELLKVTLLPGESLWICDGVPFHCDANMGVYGATVALADPRFISKALLADQSNSTTTLTEVTGLTVSVGVGFWHFKYLLRVQSAAATTGHRFSVNHDGTVSFFLAAVQWPGGTTASSDAVDQDFVAAGGQIQSGFVARAKSTTGWGTTLSVDTAAADVMYEIEGSMEVTVAGNIELWHGSEVAAASTVKAGSMLEIQKAA